MRYRLCISSVTYNRVLKWVGLMNNLRKVTGYYHKVISEPRLFDVEFLFVHDSKTNYLVRLIKFLITYLFLHKYKFKFIEGKDNLGESRDVAMEDAYWSKFDFIGFIDDDDRYSINFLGFIETNVLMEVNQLDDISIINFGMSGNFSKKCDYFLGCPDKFSRLREFDDDNQTIGCVPSMASLISIPKWKSLGLRFGYNPPSEETSPLMILTVWASKVLHISANLMFRNRASNSLVSDMSKYSEGFIESNVNHHVENIFHAFNTGILTHDEYVYVMHHFMYNYLSYFKYHGVSSELINKIEFNIKSKYNIE